MARTVPELSVLEFDFAEKSEIGRGDFGKVLSVPWKGKVVAVKVAFNRSCVENEAAMLSNIAHKNIVDFFGIVSYKNKDCIVLELAAYGSLAENLYEKSGKLKITDTYRHQWTLDIARGLTYLHFDVEPSISHGDLKSQNVLICESSRGPTAKLNDFGRGRKLESTAAVLDFGSLLWSAPEIINFEGHSVLSDVWSFGATVVEIFTSKKPYAHFGEKKAEILVDIKEGRLNPLSRLPRSELLKISAVIRGLLSRCFECDRKRRISTREVVCYLTDERRTTKVAGSQTQAEEAMDMMDTVNPYEVTTSHDKNHDNVHKFHIWWWVGSRQHFDLDLHSEAMLLGRDLRSAIIEARGPEAKAWKLRQRRSRRRQNGALLVAVEGLRFADERGEKAAWDDMEPEELCDIVDGRPVPTAGPLRTIIVVEAK